MRAASIRGARDPHAQMTSVASRPDPGPSLFDDRAGTGRRGLETLLAASAPLALNAAESLCGHDPARGGRCDWYHGFWQVLRILGLVSTPHRHGAFYRTVLGALARDGGHGRVLITGTADYAMLAQVLEAYRGQGVEPEVVVVDRCETPLMLNRWLAERQNARVETHARDILAFESPQPFDVICCHSFLSFFSPGQRPRLVARWRNLLRPGGKLVTISRVRDGWAEGPTGFTTEQSKAFLESVRRAATSLGEICGLGPEALERRAADYARRYRSHPVTSWAGLRALLEDGGFALEDSESPQAPHLADEGGSTASLASPDKANYARILCVGR